MTRRTRFFRGWVDATLMRIVDLVLTIPTIVILITVSAQASSSAGSWVFIALIIAALLWAPISRTVRGQFLSLREKEYVEAARALGASNSRIIFRHLLPNALGPIIVAATIAVAVAIITESALSFLGGGIRPPDTSLGLLVSDGQQAASTRPWLFYFPGLHIVFIALTVNLSVTGCETRSTRRRRGSERARHRQGAFRRSGSEPGPESEPARGVSSNSNGLSTVPGAAVITACLLAASGRGQPWGGGAVGRPGGAR